MRRLLVIAVLLAGLTACSDDGARARPDASAPVASQRVAPHRAQCIVGDPEGEIIVQPGSLTVTEPTTLADAVPLEPVNLEVIETSVVAFNGRATIQGIVQDYPPLPNAGLADSLADWSKRRPLAGLELGPDDGQQAVLVALRLADPTKPGHLDGVRLGFDDGRPAQDFTQPVLVEPHDALCTIEEVDGTLAWVPPS